MTQAPTWIWCGAKTLRVVRNGAPTLAALLCLIWRQCLSNIYLQVNMKRLRWQYALMKWAYIATCCTLLSDNYALTLNGVVQLEWQ